MRNLPVPLPHSLRFFGFFWDNRALDRFAQSSGSLSFRSVTPPLCVTTNMPS